MDEYDDVVVCGTCKCDFDDCECEEFDYETDDSVADGLGMRIDDDGNWVPKDSYDIRRFMK